MNRVQRAVAVPGLVAGAMVAMLILYPTRAFGAGGGDGCNPGRPDNFPTRYYIGAEQQPGVEVGGVKGYIYNYSPWVSSTDNPGVTQWVMVTNGPSWAQVGWREFPGSQRDTFVQFNIPNERSWTNSFPAYPINSNIEYAVTHDPNCTVHCFTFYANGRQLTDSNYNFAPGYGEAAAELNTQADQVPGGYNDPSPVSSLQIFMPAGSNGSWNTFTGSTFATTTGGASAPSWANISPSPGTSPNGYYSTWDSACPN